MNLYVIVDNNTIIDKYYKGEPALSFYIEDNDCKILFDTGYSDIFLENARKMGINLCDIDCIVLSHGHNDHTCGLQYLMNFEFKISYIFAQRDTLGLGELSLFSGTLFSFQGFQPAQVAGGLTVCR